jgi:hypothetical protein
VVSLGGCSELNKRYEAARQVDARNTNCTLSTVYQVPASLPKSLPIHLHSKLPSGLPELRSLHSTRDYGISRYTKPAPPSCLGGGQQQQQARGWSGERDFS